MVVLGFHPDFPPLYLLISLTGTEEIPDQHNNLIYVSFADTNVVFSNPVCVFVISGWSFICLVWFLQLFRRVRGLIPPLSGY